MKIEESKILESSELGIHDAVLDRINSLSKDEMMERLNWTPAGFGQQGAQFDDANISYSSEDSAKSLLHSNHRHAIIVAAASVVGVGLLANHIRKK